MGNLVLFSADPWGAVELVITSSPHPASCELPPPEDTEGYSPCEGATGAVLLGWTPALGTRSITDLAAAMFIDIFSWGTKPSCLLHYYMARLLGLSV